MYVCSNTEESMSYTLFYKKIGSAPSTKSFLINFAILLLKFLNWFLIFGS